MRYLVACIVLMGLGCVGCPPAPPPSRRPPRRVPCQRARGKITIDGKLDEPAWQNAELIDDFRAPATGAPAKAPTGARLLWDDEHLYVAVTMVDQDVTAMLSKDQHDAKTWEDDVAEVFVKPHIGSPVYFEFHVTPRGTTLDLLIARRDAGSFDRWRAWESGMRAAAAYQGTVNNWQDRDKGWTAELAIPLSAFVDAFPDRRAKVQLGDQWRFAICRYNYSVYLDEGRELSSSAPLTTPSFHRHEDYDILEFVE